VPPLRTPRRYRPVEHLGRGALAALPRDRPLRVATWNLQFCGGRRAPYFYEGGTTVFVDPADQARSLAVVVGVLARLDADVVLLQEVDRGSDRTDRNDQLAALLGALPGYCAVSAAVHRNRFVPFPPRQFLRRMNLHLAILARAPLLGAVRTPLPGLREPRLRAHFNLHRAILSASLPLAGGGALRVADVHLSAFSGGDDTLERQVEAVGAWLDSGESPALVGGDFNVLPPGDDPGRLPTDRDDHPRERRRIDAFFNLHASALPPAGQLRAEAGTYLPPGANGPDRTLDWIFHDATCRPVRAWVEAVDPFVSDHWPVVAELALAAR
jgi:endonuclease/exonuclease/phosphatase family metal-dependent hydrolase